MFQKGYLFCNKLFEKEAETPNYFNELLVLIKLAGFVTAKELYLSKYNSSKLF